MPNDAWQAAQYAAALDLQRLLPDEGVPLKFLDRRGEFHRDGRHFGGVEVIPAGWLEPEDLIGQTVHIKLSEENPVVDRKSIIKARMEQLEAELVELEQFGEDKFDDNTVLVFDMKFPNNETIFTYAALKKEGVWFITGVQQGSYKTWAQLVAFWKDKVVSIHKVSAFEELFMREDAKAKALEGEVLDKGEPEKDVEYDGPKD